MAKQDLTNARFAFLDKNTGPDYVLRSANGGNFTEFVVSVGGDVRTYRVYGDNPDTFKVYEK